jgi:hypothetical protein
MQEWDIKCNLSVPIVVHTAIKELWEAVFSLGPVAIMTSCNRERTVRCVLHSGPHKGVMCRIRLQLI